MHLDLVEQIEGIVARRAHRRLERGALSFHSLSNLSTVAKALDSIVFLLWLFANS